jgi:hypothetical protein
MTDFMIFKGEKRASDYNIQLKCNLCGMEFHASDDLFDERKTRHEEWHKHCKVQKRNTTEGKVEWIQK